MRRLILIQVLSFIFLIESAPSPPEITVEVKNGMVRGQWKDSAGSPSRKYGEFMNIPYAKPPVGELRFQPPQPAEKWTGIVGDPVTPIYCFQALNPYWLGDPDGTEDCLYLHVHSPRLEANASLPVLVYIHGGGFRMGSGSAYNPKYLMDHDMVVVTFNYRLGALGFLSTEDAVAPGNVGLKDQVMALRWVQENIKSFGGDPGRVTLAGADAGAASVHYHYLSEMSRGTFHRGIAMGGSAFTPWAYSNKLKQKTETLAKFLNCSASTSQEIVDCLREASLTDIILAEFHVLDFPVFAFTPFVPTIEAPAEGAFITQHPYEATKSDSVNKAPLLASVTKDEGIQPFANLFGGSWYWQGDSLIIKDMLDTEEISKMFYFEYNNVTLPVKDHARVAEQIMKYYSMRNYTTFIKAMGDRLYVSKLGKMVELLAARPDSPVYLYKYSFRAEPPLRQDEGVNHGEDMLHIFEDAAIERVHEQDIEMRKVLAKMVYRYCNGENPTLSDDGPHWAPVTPGKPLNYLEILSPTSFEAKSDSDFGHRSFWDSLGFNEDQDFRKDLLL